MARILVSFIGISTRQETLIACFYESLLEALRDQGNDVLYLTTNDFIDGPCETNKLNWYYNAGALARRVQDFAPELVLCTNNSLPTSIRKIIDCPIALWTADAPCFYPERPVLQAHQQDFTFFSISEGFDQSLHKDFGVPKNRIHRLQFATDVQAEPILQDKNVSFVGSNWRMQADFAKSLGKIIQKPHVATHMQAIAHLTREAPTTSIEELMDKAGVPAEVQHLISALPRAQLLNMLANNHRLQTLSSLSELGLSLHGPADWLEMATFSLELALCYNPKSIFTRQQTEWLYNSSRVCPNISHAQAIGTFGWRVRDVMASNAALLSTPSADFKATFGSGVQVPTFETPEEAYYLTKKLLNEPEWCREIVQSSQEIINQGHRFHHRLKDIGQVMGVSLLNAPQPGTLQRLRAEDFRHPLRYTSFNTSNRIFEFGIRSLLYQGNLFTRLTGQSPKNVVEAIKSAKGAH